VPKTAKQLLDQIHQNIAEWHRGSISFEIFEARQKATWNTARDLGPEVWREVLAGIRSLFKGAPSAQSLQG
jgi:hypothetical protein